MLVANASRRRKGTFLPGHAPQHADLVLQCQQSQSVFSIKQGAVTATKNSCRVMYVCIYNVDSRQRVVELRLWMFGSCTR